MEKNEELLEDEEDLDFATTKEIVHDEHGNILKTVGDIFHESMLPYSEYVILDRALPRVEDGLKPVQRRILYSMYDIGLTPDKPYKKSAKVVGDVIANYHPHGDSSAYGAMVRLAQNFNMRETLVDGHGNFGSVDGDPPAALRYTEARLAPLALEMLRDIEKDTVHWSFNFDDTRYEPDMLPSRYPNLLVNGSNGIAVGLATNIPTHNLGEAIDGCCAYIDNPEMTLEDMMEIIKGPDFPTGAIILGYEGLKSAYKTGRGKFIIRSKTQIEDAKGGKKDIIITEFPYSVNKSECLLKISQLRETHKEILGGIADIRDESDKEGIRAVISIKSGYDAEQILAYLFQNSDLQINFSVNTVAIANGKPQLLGLMDIIKYYTEYQREIIYNRTKHDLESAKERANILEGLIIAIVNIDEVVRVIKTSESTTIAKANLCIQFELNERQAQAILDMRLGRLTSLEVEKLQEELDGLHKLIAKLTKVLASKTIQYNLVKKEMQSIKNKYPSERRTKIEKNVEVVKKVDISAMLPPEDCVICVGQRGYIKRVSIKTYNKTGRIITETTSSNEIHSFLINATTRSKILIFTDQGNYCTLDSSVIPDVKWKERGTKLKDLCVGIAQSEVIVGIFAYKDKLDDGNFIFYTSDGNIKMVAKSEYNAKNGVMPALKMKENTKVVSVESNDENNDSMFMVTQLGVAIRVEKNEMIPTSKTLLSQKGMNINDNDEVIFAKSVKDGDKVIVMAKNGYIKQVCVDDFERVPRGRKGLKIITFEEEKNQLIFVDIVNHKKEIYVITDQARYVIPNTAVPLENRTTKGKIVIKGLKQQKIKNVLKYEWDTEDVTLI